MKGKPKGGPEEDQYLPVGGFYCRGNIGFFF